MRANSTLIQNRSIIHKDFSIQQYITINIETLFVECSDMLFKTNIMFKAFAAVLTVHLLRLHVGHLYVSDYGSSVVILFVACQTGPLVVAVLVDPFVNFQREKIYIKNLN